MQNEEDYAQGKDPSLIKRHTVTETKTRNTQQQDLQHRPGGERMKRINQQTNVLSTKNVFWNVLTSIHCT